MGGHDGPIADERPSCSGEERSPQVVRIGVAYPRAVQPLRSGEQKQIHSEFTQLWHKRGQRQ